MTSEVGIKFRDLLNRVLSRTYDSDMAEGIELDEKDVALRNECLKLFAEAQDD